MLRRTLISVLIGSWLVVAASAQVTSRSTPLTHDQTKERGVVVVVEEVVAYGTPQKPLYEVSYEYKAKGRKTVFIREGPGTVAAEGKFKYFATALNLTFLDAPDGTLLATVPLEITSVPAGRPSETLPGESEFPSAGRNTDWHGSSVEFKPHLNKILDSMGLGYAFCSTENQCIITPYKVINFPAQHGEKGHVAIKITYIEDNGGLHLRVYAKTQEKLSHGSWLDPDDEDVPKAADVFVSQLLKQLGSAR